MELTMPTIQKEVSDRSFFGKLVKWVFIGFNLLMLIWLVAGFGVAGQSMDNTVNDAERAGAAIGSTIGIGLIVMVWALGDVILGILVLLTRRKKLITIEE
ncbi:MAG: hypothetical protein WC692_07735 [Erythrobacter sp.]